MVDGLKKLGRAALAAACIVMYSFSCDETASAAIHQENFRPLDFSPVIESSWEGGDCFLNLSSGEIIFEVDEGKAVHFSSGGLTDEDPLLLVCGQNDTVVVSSGRITQLERGASNEMTPLEGMLLEWLTAEYGPGVNVGPLSSAFDNDEGEKNIAAALSPGGVVVLTSMGSDGSVEIRRLDRKKHSVDAYAVDDVFFVGKAAIAFYSGLTIMAGEAGPGKTFLFGFVLHENLYGYSFKALEFLEGEIAFNEEEDYLLLGIGASSCRISVDLSNVNLTNKNNVGCFKHGVEKGPFYCISFAPSQ